MAGTGQTLTEKATEMLRDAIFTGLVAPGDSLQEKTACELTGMSRTPIRIAMTTLAKEGLLEYKPQRGFKVRRFNMTSVAHAFEVRGALEGLAARLAAERGLHAADLQDLELCVDEGEALLGMGEAGFDRDAWREMNRRFHHTIHTSTGNSLLVDMIEQAQRIPFTTLKVIAHWRGRESLAMLRMSQMDHVYILRALEKRQGARAEARMREHIQVALDLIREQVEDARIPRFPEMA